MVEIQVEPMNPARRAVEVRGVQLGLGDVARSLRSLLNGIDDPVELTLLGEVADAVDVAIDAAAHLGRQ